MVRVRRRRSIAVALGVVLGAAAAWLAIQVRPSDRERIEEVVTRAERGIETKSVKEIMRCVSPDFVGEGGMDRDEVWRLAAQWARSASRAEVVIQDYELQIHPPRARGRFDVVVHLELEGGPSIPLGLELTVEFERRWRGLRRVWLVKSVTGYDPELFLEEYL